MGAHFYLRRPSEPGGSCHPHLPGLGLHQIWHCRKTSIFSHPHPKDKSVPHRIRHLVSARECFGFPKFIACSHPPSNRCYWFTHPSWLVELNEDVTNWRKTLSLEGAPLFWKDVSSPPHFYIYKYFFLLIDFYKCSEVWRDELIKISKKTSMKESKKIMKHCKTLIIRMEW